MPPPQRPTPPAPRRQGLKLDAAQFTPLSDAQIKDAARAAGSSLWSPWFGRRDRIPPADDPRTALIDRALLAHGLLSEQDLVEIHQAGAKMDELRPDMAAAQIEAERAVQRSIEERKRIKEQKKAEAAERKRLHAERVKERRATDIIHLGRGVSAGLADRRANVEKLSVRGLPVLATPADVAQALGISIAKLRWLAHHAEAATREHYVRFTVPKRSGGVRQLAAPRKSLAAAQEWILKNILEKVPAHEAAHGFVPGRCTASNAKRHVGAQVLLNADLVDFFPSINVWRVIGVFKELGYSPAAATVLALLCTESPRRTVVYDGRTYHVATGPRALPQGACTSPALSNLVARRLDARLSGIATKLGWNYTRYADDLTFSATGEAVQKAGYMLARLRHIAMDESFAVNEKKTRVQRRHHAMTVTGVVVNDRAGVERKLVRRLRAILHAAKKTGLKAQNRQNLPHFEAWVRGMIAYVNAVNPQQAQPLRQAWDAL